MTTAIFVKGGWICLLRYTTVYAVIVVLHSKNYFKILKTPKVRTPPYKGQKSFPNGVRLRGFHCITYGPCHTHFCYSKEYNYVFVFDLHFL